MAYRSLFGSALTAAVALAAAPASAQLAPASAIGLSKTEAILGGAPSRLAAIMAQQAGVSVAPMATAAMLPLRPYGFSQAILRQPSAPISADRPDVFNSVALKVANTSLDARWRRVAHSRATGAAGVFAAGLRSRDEGARIDAVNRYVNRRVSFVDDRVQYHAPDRWSAASETLGRGRGDCEDYAIAKMAMLRAAGVAERDLYLVILKDLVRRADHAVLVVRSAGRYLVLDNGTDQIVDSSEVRDYRPILTFTAGQAYTHGYRRELPTVTYAALTQRSPVALLDNNVPAPAAMASADLDQRSRSASLLAFNTGLSR